MNSAINDCMQCACHKLTCLPFIMVICYIIMLLIICRPAVLSFVTDKYIRCYLFGITLFSRLLTLQRAVLC